MYKNKSFVLQDFMVKSFDLQNYLGTSYIFYEFVLSQEDYEKKRKQNNQMDDRPCRFKMILFYC